MRGHPRFSFFVMTLTRPHIGGTIYVKLVPIFSMSYWFLLLVVPAIIALGYIWSTFTNKLAGLSLAIIIGSLAFLEPYSRWGFLVTALAMVVFVSSTLYALFAGAIKENARRYEEERQALIEDISEEIKNKLAAGEQKDKKQQ